MKLSRRDAETAEKNEPFFAPIRVIRGLLSFQCHRVPGKIFSLCPSASSVVQIIAVHFVQLRLCMSSG